jgi:predicted transcriptional regulator
MAAGSIVLSLLMNTGSFVTDSDRAAKAAKKNAKEIEAAFSAMATTAAAAFTATAGALALIAVKAIDGVDALNDVADATGASIENISALEYVAQKTGTTLDNVSGILVKFNNVLKEAEPDSAMAKALEAIGLNVEELRKLDPAEALRVTAAALSQYADDGNRARLVQELFGKSVKDAAPFLKDLAEQTKLVSTTTKEQAQQAEDFNKAIFEMQANISLLAREFAVGLLPTLKEGADLLRDFTKDEDAMAAATSVLNTALSAVKVVFQTLAVIASDVVFVFQGIGREIGAIAAQTVALAKLDIRAFTAISDAVKEDSARARKELDAFQARILGLAPRSGAPAAGGAGAALPSVGVLPGTGSGKADKAAAASAKKARDELQAAQVQMAEQVLAFKSIEDQTNDALRERAVMLDKAAESYRDLLDPTRELHREIEAIQRLVDAGALTPDEGLAAEVKKLKDFYGEAKDQLSTFEEFTKSAARNMQTAFADFLFDPFAEGTENMLKNFGTMIQRMIAEAVSADLMNRLVAGTGKGGFGGKDSFGGLLDIASSIFGGFRADGGSVTAGKAYVVGERRPELFVPNTSGMILPSTEMATSSSNQSINLTVNVASGTPEQVRRAAGAGAREALSALSSAQRYA